MKFKILFVFVLVFASVGCANKQLDTLRDIDRQNRVGLIEAYDEAIYRTKMERVDVEEQLIDLQSDYDLAIQAYEAVTGKSFDEVATSSFISLDKLAAHYEEVNTNKALRKVEIFQSYDRFYETINEAKDPKLMEAIAEIEEERDKTESGFLQGFFDVVKKLLPF